jgi:hypothetical protein
LYYWGLGILEITYQVGVGTDGTKQNRGVKRRSADDGHTDVRTYQSVRDEDLQPLYVGAKT